MELYTCSKCGLKSTPQLFSTKTWCKKCRNEYGRNWKQVNKDLVSASRKKCDLKNGIVPMDKNKSCGLYLGVHIAENVLSHVFKNVEKMSCTNPGFDFICTHNQKIDVKSGCIMQRSKNRKKRNFTWSFDIRHNKIADYFLILAFSNRQELKPMYMWLIPADVINHLKTAMISEYTISKWFDFELNINKTIKCCNVMKQGELQNNIEHRITKEIK